MKYLCLVYLPEAEAAAADLAATATDDESALLREVLQASGGAIVCGELGAAQATSVSMRNGAPELEERTCAQFSGRLIAFQLLEARDLNDAVRWASRLQAAQRGTVAIWPVLESCD